MSRSDRGLVAPRLIVGLMLIAIGIVYMLDRLEYLEAGNLWNYWPVILIAAGLGKLLSPGSSSSRTTGLLIAGVGSWILLDNMDLVSIGFWKWWPVLLIVLGLRLIFSRQRTISADSVDTVNSLAIMGGAVRTNSSANFRGGDMVAFMGGCEIDLTGAQISGSPAVIDAFALWGGVEIKVPASWHVTAKGIPLIGTYEDTTEVPEGEPGAVRQELVVKGFAIMGGVEVRN